MFASIYLLASCSGMPKPNLALSQARFAEPPRIVRHGARHYLRYRMAMDSTGVPPLRRILVADTSGGRLRYFLSSPTSFPEWGNTVEHPLAMDGSERFATEGLVYWLDPDGSETRLAVEPPGDSADPR